MKNKKYQKTIEKLRIQYPQFKWSLSPKFLEAVDKIMKEHHDVLKELADR